MPSFRKKPVVVEAIRTFEPFVIETLEGKMQALPGDWIIKGVNGELYPCKDDVFRKTYEPVDKEAVQALVAPGPDESEDREHILPFPRRECVVTAGSPLDSVVTDT